MSTGIVMNGGTSTDGITFDYNNIINCNGNEWIGVYLHFKLNAAFNTVGATRLCSQWGSGVAAVWLCQSVASNTVGFLVKSPSVTTARRGAESSITFSSGGTYRMFWTFVATGSSHEHRLSVDGTTDSGLSSWADSGLEFSTINNYSEGSEVATQIGYEATSGTGGNDITVYEFARFTDTGTDNAVPFSQEDMNAVTSGSRHPMTLPGCVQHTTFWNTNTAQDLIGGSQGTVLSGCTDGTDSVRVYGPPHSGQILVPGSSWNIVSVSSDDVVGPSEDPWNIAGRGFGAR